MIRLSGARRGFTLIELLVVIAIIGVLGGIISVSFGSARERARDVKRKAELSQFGRLLSVACPVPSFGPGDYDLGALIVEFRATNQNAASFLQHIPYDPSGNETETRYRYIVDASRRCALYANLQNDAEPVTLRGINTPTPGGGTGVFRAPSNGWNGSPNYFQVSN